MDTLSSEVKLSSNLFLNVFNAIGEILGDYKESAINLFSNWKKRLTSCDELRSYIAAEWQKTLWILIYIAINLGLFIEAVVRYAKILNGTYHWVWMARGFGQLLNFNCALIILPVCRSLLTTLRRLKFGFIIPFDKNIQFHRYIAYNIAIFSILHGIAHYGNYSCCYFLYKEARTVTTVHTPTQASWATIAGLTGNILAVVMVLMYAAATKAYRASSNFTIFWYTHQLFVVFYIALLLHGKNFWMWFLGPGMLYLMERILRNFRGAMYTTVKRVHALPGRVVFLELEKPAFHYKAGQYAFINCPLISRHEWHPFTISSTPEEEVLTFHIRCAGDWTNSLMTTFNPDRKETVVIDQPTTPDGLTYLIRVDGPFGTCAEDVWNFEYVVLIATGIGVTPYASLLKHIRERLHNEGNLKMKKCFFIWLNREGGSFDWFADVLINIEEKDPTFFNIKTYMTGGLNEKQVKNIIYSSEEYFERQDEGGKQQAAPTIEILSRASHQYKANAADEIDLEVGDEVTVLSKNDQGWWHGTNKRTGKTGDFPGTYVTIIDSVTKLKASRNRQFGRPVWEKEFEEIRQNVESAVGQDVRKSVGVFFCGPSVLSKELYKQTFKASKGQKITFTYHKENF